MAKPILLVYYLPEALIKNGDYISSSEANILLAKRFYDYHVLAVPSFQSADGTKENWRIEVYNATNFTDIEFNDLKEKLLKSIDDLK